MTTARSRTIAVILASGTGQRSGLGKPKQLVKLAGRPLMAHTLERFQQHHAIDEIAIVTNNYCINEIEAMVNRDRLTKVKRVLLGGQERYESSLAAINAFRSEHESDDWNLVFHDAVRPLISDRIISDVVDALQFYRAVDVAIASADTVVFSDPDTSTIRQIPDRRWARLGQTPQAFKLGVIAQAYDAALEDPNFRTTDDCGVVVRYLPDEPVFIVEGAPTNIKLTYPDDLMMLDKLMQTNAARRLDAIPETTLLSKLRGKGIAIIGGTSGIGEAMCRMAASYGAKVYAGGRSTGVDIGDPASVARFFERAADADGAIDAVVNAAAILNRQPLANMTDEDITNDLQTNIIGAALAAKCAYPYLAQSRGHLLFFASSSYTYGRAFYSTYSASKAAVVNLTQALADEWSDAGVKVNCLNPERTKTPMRTKAFGEEAPGTLLAADEVARKALGVLVSQSTGFIFDVVRQSGQSGQLSAIEHTADTRRLPAFFADGS